MKRLLDQMFRFGIVGAINGGVDMAVFFAALATLTSSLVFANALAWVVAVTSSYLLNARFTFRSPRRNLDLPGYFLFALTQAAGFAAHTLVLVATAPLMPLLAAKLFGIAVGFVVNFSLARTVVFGSGRGPA